MGTLSVAHGSFHAGIVQQERITMRNRIIIGLVAGGLALAGSLGMTGGAQAASQDVDVALSNGLDRAELQFTRHNREHRMWEIQRNMERQQRAARRHHYGPPRGYARPGYGYGRPAPRGYYGTPGWAGRRY
jgi:hypothetical protein